MSSRKGKLAMGEASSLSHIPEAGSGELGAREQDPCFQVRVLGSAAEPAQELL